MRRCQLHSWSSPYSSALFIIIWPWFTISRVYSSAMNKCWTYPWRIRMYGRLMLTKLGYIDGKWQTIYSIHTDPMGYRSGDILIKYGSGICDKKSSRCSMENSPLTKIERNDKTISSFSILVRFSLINQSFWGYPHDYGNHHLWSQVFLSFF